MSVLKRYFVEQAATWKRAETLLEQGGKTGNGLTSDELRELGLLYRSLIHDLSRARSDGSHHHLVPYLNQLAHQVHSRVYQNEPTRWRDILRFFTHQFPQAYWRQSHWITLSFAVFCVGAALAMAMVAMDSESYRYFLPDTTVAQLAEGKLWVKGEEGALSQSSFLMSNNIGVAVRSFSFGVVFGFGTLFFMVFNGMFAFGGPLMVTAQYGLADDLLYFMIAHGVIELTTIFIAGGAGMAIGFALLFPGDLPRWAAVRQRSRDALVLVMGCIPLLIFAGLVEGLLSLENDVPNEVRVAVGVLSGLFFFGYLMLRRRVVMEPMEPIEPMAEPLS